MKLNNEFLEDIELLTLFRSDSSQQGIKIHHDAEQIRLNAAERLYDKNLITQVDGGYLTPLGIQATEHVSALVTILQP